MRPFRRSDREGWWIRFKDGSGRWVTRKGGRSEGEARVLLDREERNAKLVREGYVTHGQVRAAEHCRRPIGEVIDEYCDYLRGRGVTEHHLKEAERCVRAVVEAIGGKCLRDIEAGVVERWLGRLRQDGRSARTRNVYLVRIRAMVNWAFNRGMMTENPLRVIEKLPDQVDRREVSRALTPEEFSRLLLSTPSRERRLYYLFAGRAGLRWGEIRRLRWQDVRLEEGAIHLTAAGTKSKKDAVVPLAPDLLEALKRCEKCVGRIFSSSPILRTFKADLKRAGIEYENERGQADRKGLRKMFGTHLALSKVDIRVTQRLMRHSTPALTSNIYTDEGLLEMAEAVEGLCRVEGA